METVPTDAPMPFATTDHDLVDRIRRGDDDAFETLVREHAGTLLKLTARILGDDDEAPDVVQETFLSAIKKIAEFRADAAISTWLHRIAVNASLMRLRAKRRREISIESLLPRFTADGHHPQAPSRWSDASAQAESSEIRSLVRECIDRLPTTYRVILVLREIEGRSGDEVAELLGITCNAVKIRLHRARLALRELLDARFGSKTP